MNVSKQATSEATELFRACLVNGTLEAKRVRDVVQQLGAARPRGYLATLSVFRRLVKLECARHTVKVESAVPLAADLQASVLKKLEDTYGTGLSTSFVDNPTLIGGMRIRVGSDLYDGSVRGRLAALERRF